MTWIQTRSSKAVDLTSPQPDTIDFGDIAWSLAHLCRFTGHTRTHYSVAEHCLRVAAILPENLQIHGLLHDAPEAYIGDVSTPVKELCDSDRLRQADMDLDEAIYSAAGVDTPSPSVRRWVKRADLVLLATERRDLLDPSPQSWGEFERIIALPGVIVPLCAFQAEIFYLEALERCGVRGAGVRRMAA